MARNPSLTRRQFIQGAGGLVVGFSLADAAVLPRLLASGSPGATAGVPSPDQLDSWLRIEPSGSVSVFTDKVDVGMGVETAFAQIIAEELDLTTTRVHVVMGDTSETPDQGGTGGSTAISLGARPLRNAAATARYLLLQMASHRLGAPVADLQVTDGVVHLASHPSGGVSYGDLVGSKELNAVLKVTGHGFSVNVASLAKPKDPKDYTIVGRPVPRVDLPPKLFGQFPFTCDVRVPGMLHGRVIRPPAVGATVEKVNEDSVRWIPGYVKTVSRGGFVGVVAQTEWAAIRAARALKVSWSGPAPVFPAQNDLYNYMSSAAPKSSRVITSEGDVSAALSRAAKTVDAVYRWPFQSHATMGSGCAVADVHPDGVTTVWTGIQKPHELRKGIAGWLRVPPDRVRVIWVEDAGSYGRPGYADVAADAVLLSQAVGRPVRVQWTRADMTAWGTKGPAYLCEFSGALDSGGTVTALNCVSRVFSGSEISAFANSAGNLLAAQLTGVPNTTGHDEYAGYGDQSVSYNFENVHSVSHVVAAFHPLASPLRTTHLRDPEGPAVSFSVESFIDELAAAAGADPIEFRVKHNTHPRVRAVLAAAAELAKWDHRPSPQKTSGDLAVGRGVALCTRHGTYVATIAEVEVDRRSGAIRVRRFVCAHDCGLIINPDGLRGVILANLVQSLSRAVKEEVIFDRHTVTSDDWHSYPVVRSTEVPGQIDIVLLDHPEIPSGGAGEPSTRPTAAAIANAVFDATGVRLREVPMTPARVKAALAAARA
ncbi:MAG TPA: molybdopterin cofactor-binding domain-containing protein [Candidatus Dormibacteraeota bacterium]|nr:molybdopterin cofactor-binding domain-containing protein [Candidatus Dormibacteraeota bacterium]